jgi:hypothetical protein
MDLLKILKTKEEIKIFKKNFKSREEAKAY